MLLGAVSGGVERKSARPPEPFSWRVDVLKMLAFVLGHTCAVETSCVSMRSKQSSQQRRTAAVEATHEDQSLAIT